MKCSVLGVSPINCDEWRDGLHYESAHPYRLASRLHVPLKGTPKCRHLFKLKTQSFVVSPAAP